MPVESYIDAMGAVDPIMVYGMKCGQIFGSDDNRDYFLHRLGGIFPDTAPVCVEGL